MAAITHPDIATLVDPLSGKPERGLFKRNIFSFMNPLFAKGEERVVHPPKGGADRVSNRRHAITDLLINMPIILKRII